MPIHVKKKRSFLPSLSSRRKVQDTLGHASNSATVSHFPATQEYLSSERSAVDSIDEMVSALLNDTVATETSDELHPMRAQKSHFTRSHTVGFLPKAAGSLLARDSHMTTKTVATSPMIPTKSSKRDRRGSLRDNAQVSPKRSPDGLVRPLPKSQTVSSINMPGQETHRIRRSMSVPSPGKLGGRYSAINQPRNSDAQEVNNKIAMVLAATAALKGEEDTEARVVGSSGPSMLSRFKNNKVFAKFSGVLADHFNIKGSQKHERLGAATNEQYQPLADPTLGSLLEPLEFPEQRSPVTSVMISLNVGDNLNRNGKAQALFAEKARKIPRKPLRDDKVRQASLDDPFSESSFEKRPPTEFEARLKNASAHADDRNSAPRSSVATNPFESERIMDTSVEAILITPPVGCSTPRAHRGTAIVGSSPPKGFKSVLNADVDVLVVSPHDHTTNPCGRRKVAIIGESPTKKKSTQATTTRVVSRFSDCSSSTVWDSTDAELLETHVPRKTIRHVPRSMGRLTDVPLLSAPGKRDDLLPLGRKKHPSPSKSELEKLERHFKKYAPRSFEPTEEEDELALSMRSSKSPTALTPRDSNRMMRNSVATTIGSDRSEDTKSHRASISKPSRIPVPKGKLVHSRTAESLFSSGRFNQAFQADAMAIDELQWTSSPHRRFGSTAGAVH